MKKFNSLCITLLTVVLAHSQKSADTVFCIMPNSTVTIKISYEFQLVDNAIDDQKFVEVKCQIDANGFIQLPVLYNSRQHQDFKTSSTKRRNQIQEEFLKIDSSEISKLSEGEYDSMVTKYHFQMPNLSCNESCLTYYQAGKILTSFYRERIGLNADINQIFVQIIPETYFQTITVFHKGKQETLPYSNLLFGDYFKDPKVKYQLGLRRKATVVIQHRCRLTSGKGQDRGSKPFKFKFNCNRNKVNPLLEEGDSIYLN